MSPSGVDGPRDGTRARVEPNSKRWTTASDSAFNHERAALAWLRRGLKDQDPNRGWSNFEFAPSSGALNELDALVLTAAGPFTEAKSCPGEIGADGGMWQWVAPTNAGCRPSTTIGCSTTARRNTSLTCWAAPGLADLPTVSPVGSGPTLSSASSSQPAPATTNPSPERARGRLLWPVHPIPRRPRPGSRQVRGRRLPQRQALRKEPDPVRQHDPEAIFVASDVDQLFDTLQTLNMADSANRHGGKRQ